MNLLQKSITLLKQWILSGSNAQHTSSARGHFLKECTKRAIAMQMSSQHCTVGRAKRHFSRALFCVSILQSARKANERLPVWHRGARHRSTHLFLRLDIFIHERLIGAAVSPNYVVIFPFHARGSSQNYTDGVCYSSCSYCIIAAMQAACI